MFQRLHTGWVTHRQLALVRSVFGLQVQVQLSKKEKASKPKS
jgi:hypothetical protein